MNTERYLYLTRLILASQFKLQKQSMTLYLIIIESEGDGSGNFVGNYFPELYLHDNESDALNVIYEFLKENLEGDDFDYYFRETSWRNIQDRQSEAYDEFDKRSNDEAARERMSNKFNEMDKEVNRRSYEEAAKIVLKNGCVVAGPGEPYDKVLKVKKVTPNEGLIDGDWGPSKGAIKSRKKNESKPEILLDEEEIWEIFMG